MKKLFLAVVLAVVIALGMGPNLALALPYVDFSAEGEGGSIKAFSSGIYTGTNIPITVFVAVNTPSNAGEFAVTGGLLSFDTTPGSTSIEIVGAIPGLGISSQTLLDGTILSFTIINNPSGGFQISMTGPDEKARELVLALGLPVDINWEHFGGTITGSLIGTTTDYVEYTATSTDIKNTAVPEPSAMILLGGGLIALWGFRKRIKK